MAVAIGSALCLLTYYLLSTMNYFSSVMSFCHASLLWSQLILDVINYELNGPFLFKLRESCILSQQWEEVIKTECIINAMCLNYLEPWPCLLDCGTINCLTQNWSLVAGTNDLPNYLNYLFVGLAGWLSGLKRRLGKLRRWRQQGPRFEPWHHMLRQPCPQGRLSRS